VLGTQKRLALPASLYEMLQIFSLTLFEKTPINGLFDLPNQKSLDADPNQLNLFNYRWDASGSRPQLNPTSVAMMSPFAPEAARSCDAGCCRRDSQTFDRVVSSTP
jgi:hypothetical protein